ncbi:hypothetical protein AB0F81_18960 [Actinoplanes sp. NPDC024001]|uniref:hypothetical protein n=1 Tax=Actinoplanes sp. NPDC024001 TaxID=3154598 RepID=UPI0033FBC830
MRISRAVLAAAVLLATTAVGFGFSAGTASADQSSALPVTSLGDVVVDGLHQQILLSDPSSGEIVAAGYDGAVKARLANLPGVRGLELSADSSMLYAAVDEARAVVTVSTETLTEVDRYPLGDAVYPQDVTVAGDRIWFGYDDSTGRATGNFGSVDSSGTVRLHELGGDVYHHPPRVFASPAAPGQLLVALDGGAEAGFTKIYDVSSGTERATFMMSANGFSIEDALFVPGGSGWVLVGDVCRQLGSSINLQPFPCAAFTKEIDMAGDGRFAVGKGAAVKVLSALRLAEWSVTLPHPLATGGLAWEPSGTQLFAVTKNGDQFALHALQPQKSAPPQTQAPERPATPITAAIKVHGPASAVRGRPLTISGTTTDIPGGSSLMITRTDPRIVYEDPEIATVTTDASGAFRFVDAPPDTGTIKYTAFYEGRSGVSGSVTVKVSTLTPTLSLDRNGTVHNYRSKVTFTATLGSTATNRVVELWAQPHGDLSGRQLIVSARANSAGKVSGSFTLTSNTTVTARFAGDAAYSPRAVTSVVYSKVWAGTRISRHSSMKKIGSIRYHVFRTSKDPRFTNSVTLHPGRSAHTVVQRYRNGKWRNFYSEYSPLDHHGTSSVVLNGTFKAGAKFRVRTEYVRGTSGDNVNYTTYGPWKYFTFKKK